MGIAEHGIETAAQAFVGQDGVQIEGCFRNAHLMALGRDGAVEIGQRLAVIEGANFRHKLAKKIEGAVCFRDEAVQLAVPVPVCLCVVAFDQGSLGTRDATADDLSDMFNYARATPIPAIPNSVIGQAIKRQMRYGRQLPWTQGVVDKD